MPWGSKQEPIRVVVEHKRSGGGCGSALVVMVLLGLAIEYWYVVVVVVAIVVVVAVVAQVSQHGRAKEQKAIAARRPGPQDSWLNEVAVALAEFGLTESARNTGTQLGGVPIEADIGLDAPRFRVFVTLFSTNELARQAELGLRANPKVRAAIDKGATAIRTVEQIVYVANGRGGVVDEFRLGEVVQIVQAIPLPVPRLARTGPSPRHQLGSGSGVAGPVAVKASSDALEQLRRLGELRAAGLVSDAEFEAKKAELLRRV
jgi:hypothetical protein